MQALPHVYTARAAGDATGVVRVQTGDLAPLATDAPPQFGGPTGRWSPEALLLAAVADCYVLSFRAVARASHLLWRSLEVEVAGVLDRVDGVTRFTRFKVMPRLMLEEGGSEALARGLLEKAKRYCLVSNSLLAACELAPRLVLPEATA